MTKVAFQTRIRPNRPSSNWSHSPTNHVTETDVIPHNIHPRVSKTQMADGMAGLSSR